MSIKVLRSQIFIHNIHTRMPFRYGIAEMKSVPHVFLRLECIIDGVDCLGFSAESLIPKWFTKNHDTKYSSDLEEMFSVIDHACKQVISAGDKHTLFDLWMDVYQNQKKWSSEQGFPSLLWIMGVSLVERALIDAFCRSKDLTLHEVIKENLIGIRLGEIHTELAGLQPVDLISWAPLKEINIRHTVGLSDYLKDTDIPGSSMLHDGLPQSLEANIRTYGLRYFKIKINGNLDQDLERLCQITNVLETNGVDNYLFTLDGNEQYHSVPEFRLFWEKLSEPGVCALDLRKLLFVEQPIHRDEALSAMTGEELLAWQNRPSIIIDESDSELESMKTALSLGYSGTSHKNCKGIIKTIANLCLLNSMKVEGDGNRYILSGEDLANVGPIALLQDLAVMALAGVVHVERNGHQYFRGLNGFSPEVQAYAQKSYPDLFKKLGGFVSININDGKIKVKFPNRNGFGGQETLTLEEWFQPKENWKFESLKIH